MEDERAASGRSTNRWLLTLKSRIYFCTCDRIRKCIYIHFFFRDYVSYCCMRKSIHWCARSTKHGQ